MAASGGTTSLEELTQAIAKAEALVSSGGLSDAELSTLEGMITNLEDARDAEKDADDQTSAVEGLSSKAEAGVHTTAAVVQATHLVDALLQVQPSSSVAEELDDARALLSALEQNSLSGTEIQQWSEDIGTMRKNLETLHDSSTEITAAAGYAGVLRKLLWSAGVSLLSSEVLEKFKTVKDSLEAEQLALEALAGRVRTELNMGGLAAEVEQSAGLVQQVGTGAKGWDLLEGVLQSLELKRKDLEDLDAATQAGELKRIMDTISATIATRQAAQALDKQHKLAQAENVANGDLGNAENAVAQLVQKLTEAAASISDVDWSVLNSWSSKLRNGEATGLELQGWADQLRELKEQILATSSGYKITLAVHAMCAEKALKVAAVSRLMSQVLKTDNAALTGLKHAIELNKAVAQSLKEISGSEDEADKMEAVVAVLELIVAGKQDWDEAYEAAHETTTVEKELQQTGKGTEAAATKAVAEAIHAADALQEQSEVPHDHATWPSWE